MEGTRQPRSVLDVEAAVWGEHESDSDVRGSDVTCSSSMSSSMASPSSHRSIRLSTGQIIRVPNPRTQHISAIAPNTDSESSISTHRILRRPAPHPSNSAEASRPCDGESPDEATMVVVREVGCTQRPLGNDVRLIDRAPDVSTALHNTRAPPTNSRNPPSRKRGHQVPGPFNGNGASSQYRSLFQCDVCSFNTTLAQVFHDHLSGSSHKSMVNRNARCAKPFWCTFCKINIDTGLNFSTHLKSKRHRNKLRAHF